MNYGPSCMCYGLGAIGTTGLAIGAGRQHSGIFWKENPLAACTDSMEELDDPLGRSMDSSPATQAVPAGLQTPTSCERMITIASAVNHSLQSLPLHLLADRPLSATRARSSGTERIMSSVASCRASSATSVASMQMRLQVRTRKVVLDAALHLLRPITIGA
jgi:hypothetical protein